MCNIVSCSRLFRVGSAGEHSPTFKKTVAVWSLCHDRCGTEVSSCIRSTALSISEITCHLSVHQGHVHFMPIHLHVSLSELVGGHKQVNVELFLVFSTCIRIEISTF